jgi:hypothetical protein
MEPLHQWFEALTGASPETQGKLLTSAVTIVLLNDLGSRGCGKARGFPP